MIEEIRAKSRIGTFDSVFFDVDVDVKEQGKPVRTISKTLTFKEFVKWLSGSLREKKEIAYCPVGRIPAGYVDALISSEGAFYIAVRTPMAKRQVIYMGHPMFCAYPPLIFMLHINADGTLTKASCFALKETEVKEDTLLWQYPYGHVSKEGSICMGSVPKNNLHGLASAEKVIENFFLGEDQGHSYRNDFTLLKVSLGELFSITEKAETFPLQYLAGGNTTFKDEWKNFKN
ncbi:MAG: hypothetical protein IJN92_10170 [Lachnospiraceae bacterium]|nr:hypothetical protein [Lachnospiraceae bacterium]